MSNQLRFEYVVVSEEGLKHAMITGVAQAEIIHKDITGAKVLEIATEVSGGQIKKWILKLEVTKSR